MSDEILSEKEKSLILGRYQQDQIAGLTIEDMLEEAQQHTVEFDDWWNSCYEWFEEEALERGFDVDTKSICFAVYGGQGDHAAFEASINMKEFIEKNRKRLSYNFNKWDLNLMINGADGIDADIETNQRGDDCYVKEDNPSWMGFPFENSENCDLCPLGTDSCDLDSCPANEEQEKNQDWLENLYDELVQEMDEIRMELASKLVFTLEKEYEYLTSEECVWEELRYRYIEGYETEDNDDDANFSIKLEWHVDDVLTRAEENEIEVTLEQAVEILKLVEQNHDADHGVSWANLDTCTTDILNRNN